MQARELVKLYYRIGEVSKIVGVQPHVLRYWETEFRSIRPQKSGKGQRVYSRKDVEKLLEVKDLLRNQGFTIAGARKRLVAKPVAQVSEAPVHLPSVAKASVRPTEPRLVETLPDAAKRAGPELASGTEPSRPPATSLLSTSKVATSRVSRPAQLATFETCTEYGMCVPPTEVVLDLKSSFLGSSRAADRSARSMRRALQGLRTEMLRVLSELDSPDGELGV